MDGKNDGAKSRAQPSFEGGKNTLESLRAYIGVVATDPRRRRRCGTSRAVSAGAAYGRLCRRRCRGWRRCAPPDRALQAGACRPRSLPAARGWTRCQSRIEIPAGYQHYPRHSRQWGRHQSRGGEGVRLCVPETVRRRSPRPGRRPVPAPRGRRGPSALPNSRIEGADLQVRRAYQRQRPTLRRCANTSGNPASTILAWAPARS